MTLRDLSAKDVIQLKTGENLGRIDDVSLTSTAVSCNRSFCAGGRTVFGLLAATMTDPPVGEHPHHRTDVIMVDAGPLPGARRR